jgi:DNA-binding GntR family transcriptional regulator
VQPSAADRVAEALSEEIVQGRLQSGTRLTEETIAAALGVSRNTVREAFALLVSERIVVREPNRGVFVSSPGPDDVRDLYATRLVIEPAAVLWGPALTEASLAELRAAVDRGKLARSNGRWEDVASANQQFHRGIAALGGSRRVNQHMGIVLAEMRLVFHRMGDDPEFHLPYLDLNDEICGLLEADRRAEAADRLRDYLYRAQAQLLDALSALDG